MSFYSRNNRPKAVVPPIGDGTAPVYEEIVKDGRRSLEITGKDNLFEVVQSSKEESLVYNIISRYQRGDLMALNQRVGQYMDVVGMPTNLAEAHQALIDAQRTFDSLPADVRKKFDNSFDLYLEQVAKSTPEQIQALFGLTTADVATTEVKDGDGDVA